jgi:2-oxoglutarate ferredoxin oxidoreductase subunit beta
VFRAAERPDYGAAMDTQLVEAQARRGPGDLTALLRSGSTWTVG